MSAVETLGKMVRDWVGVREGKATGVSGRVKLAGTKVRGLLEVERDKFLAAVVPGGSGFPLDF